MLSQGLFGFVFLSLALPFGPCPPAFAFLDELFSASTVLVRLSFASSLLAGALVLSAISCRALTFLAFMRRFVLT